MNNDLDTPKALAVFLRMDEKNKKIFDIKNLN